MRPGDPDRPVIQPFVLVMLLAVLAVVLFDLVTNGFERVGLPRTAAAALVIGSLVGSLVNIPVYIRRVPTAMFAPARIGHFIYARRPAVELQVVAVNVGGCLVPLGLSAWLVTQAPIWKLALATVVVTAITNRAARVVPEKGIVMPALLPPLVAVLAGWTLSRGGDPSQATVIAYVAGAMGTLIGADLLNLGRLRGLGPGVQSIGGAGVFDGVFLVGIVAALLS